jgi:hypothetical protein
LTLIILKGHLLVEEQVDDLLSIWLRDASALSTARLSFHQRLCVLRALIPAGLRDSNVLRGAERLNTLRNRIAHTLEPKGVQEIARKFLLEFEDQEVPRKLWEAEPLHTRLKRGLAALVGQLSGMREGISAVIEIDAKNGGYLPANRAMHGTARKRRSVSPSRR